MVNIIIPKVKVALFDIDDTLAKFTEAMTASLYERGYPYYSGWQQAPGEVRVAMAEIKSDQEWWQSLEPKEEGFQLLDAACQIGYVPQILSLASIYSPEAWSGKLIWFRDLILPRAEKAQLRVVTGDKSLVDGLVLIDDYRTNQLPWLECHPSGIGLMPKNARNKDFEHQRLFKYDANNIELAIRKLEIQYQAHD